MRGSDLRWTSIPSRASRITPSRFMLQNTEYDSGSYDPSAPRLTFFFVSFWLLSSIRLMSATKRHRLVTRAGKMALSYQSRLHATSKIVFLSEVKMARYWPISISCVLMDLGGLHFILSTFPYYSNKPKSTIN